MGILNPRTRIMDVVMTSNGRASLASGGLSISYASFTDGQTYYDPASVSGSYDFATDRIMLETPSFLPQDTLAIITNDAGALLPASAFGINVDSEGRVYEASGIASEEVGETLASYIGGSTAISGLVNGELFSSAVSKVTNMFQTAFQYNTIIGSRDPLDDETEFLINPNSASFKVPDITGSLSVASINVADSIFFDRKFANLPQFRFLPPVARDSGKKIEIGEYDNIKGFNRYPYERLKVDLGIDTIYEKKNKTINFQKTSDTNDIVCQMYEITTDTVVKLDAVDYGEVNDQQDLDHPRKRIVFFGKVFLDDTDTVTFVSLFTVVFD